MQREKRRKRRDISILSESDKITPERALRYGDRGKSFKNRYFGGIRATSFKTDRRDTARLRVAAEVDVEGATRLFKVSASHDLARE